MPPLAAVLLPLLLVLGASPGCQGQGQGAAATHNITAILAAHPDLTDFSAALVSTGAAAEIDRRQTITVLVVDNAVMARLKAQKPDPKELERVIYLHVLLDYFDAAKLGSIQGGFAQVTSLYQATGKAQGSDGILNITVFTDGRVAVFTPSAPSNRLPTAFYQRSIKEVPSDIAVLQVKDLIWCPATADGAQAPAPAPASQPGAAPELMDLLSKNGCGGFAGLLAATADAVAAYDRGAGAAVGLTVFCPADKAVEAFNSTFKNLTADAWLAVLLYHGVAAHYSAQSLKAINGDVGTLATDGSKNHEYNLTVRADGDTVKLSSAAASAATVTKTLLDKAPLAVYLIDAVLLPRELSNGGQGRTAPAPAPASPPAHAPTPTPALAPPPALAPVSPPPAHAPTPTPRLAPAPEAAPPTHRRRPAPSPEDTTPAPSPDEDGQPPADQKNNGARDTASWTLGAAVEAAAAATVFLLW
ncbi:fasciclin-like arabinogalactan protein 2 [Miscanthus floridulus]|uniref:fasciclin-like arabinogalactan protein 2 n=1 Tax=Miscanthus floridulus TaxID=154761 RepID=UPI00345B034C